jgi:hypothetical protein
MKIGLGRSLENRKPLMSRPPESEVASLKDARHARRAALFLAATMSGGDGHGLGDAACPIPGLRYFAGPRVDISVAGALPSEREILAWVRHRQTTCMIGRLYPRGEQLTLAVDVYLADRGIVALTGFRLAFSEDGQRWLVGRAEDPVALRLRPEGPIPTLAPPFADPLELVAAKARADEALAAFLHS